MQKRLFRKVALDRLSSPEQLDALMQITSPRSWVALLAVGLVLAGIILWSLFGWIERTIRTEGFLIQDTDGQLMATAYLSFEDAQQVTPGMDAKVSPVTVSPQEYGFILGTVQSVGAAATTDQRAQTLFPNELVIAVSIVLRDNPATSTGYTWSIAEGPSTPIRPDTACTVTIVLEKERPINRILPIKR
jgi:hypothetical protein